MELAKSSDIDLSRGYLFRPVNQLGEVENRPLSYEAIYDRLKHYLGLLDLDAGETPHSIRAGCAISLRSVSTSDTSINQIIGNHVGWFSEGSVAHYTRSQQFDQASKLSKAMANLDNPTQHCWKLHSPLKKALNRVRIYHG
jgi:hypothetical protein